jgi:signal peptidase I
MPIYMDFSGILAIATILTGVIWLIDLLFFKPRRVREGETKEPKIAEYARSFFPILLIVFVIRSFIVEPFRIPSGSMRPTLLEGDFILVNKFTYGIRLPLLGKKVFSLNEPKQGDILVFRFPNNPKIDFIKRVIAVPGDKVSYKDKVVYVNGKPLEQTFLGITQDKEPSGFSYPVSHFREALDSGSHSIYVHPTFDQNYGEVTVPAGSYFVMGDNRDKSDDSRAWGFVPEELILGKAFLIWMSWDNQAKDMRWARMGTRLGKYSMQNKDGADANYG